jgi:hypothetical protein
LSVLLESRRVKFKCPHCEVVSQQRWIYTKKLGQIVIHEVNDCFLDYRGTVTEYQQSAVKSFLETLFAFIPLRVPHHMPEKVEIGTCLSCQLSTVWVDEVIVYPKRLFAPPANQDLDEEIRKLYSEAASILADSPRGATALLRLCLQMLLKQVGKSGKNINEDIKQLVAEGLSVKIQQALDLLRVVGNNAVHPGQIVLDDDSQVAVQLFGILNFIANELISKPKELNSLYAEIVPEETKKHISERDSNP